MKNKNKVVGVIAGVTLVAIMAGGAVYMLNNDDTSGIMEELQAFESEQIDNIEEINEDDFEIIVPTEDMREVEDVVTQENVVISAVVGGEAFAEGLNNPIDTENTEPIEQTDTSTTQHDNIGTAEPNEPMNNETDDKYSDIEFINHQQITLMQELGLSDKEIESLGYEIPDNLKRVDNNTKGTIVPSNEEITDNKNSGTSASGSEASNEQDSTSETTPTTQFSSSEAQMYSVWVPPEGFVDPLENSEAPNIIRVAEGEGSAIVPEEDKEVKFQ